ncbi:MAG: MFS transporter [Alphaproteobacteria bacterium]|nr:MFS transporter [Alphaproteobacteria bacterium]
MQIARVVADRFHYAWVVVGVVFVALLAAAGVRATPGVLIVPLQQAFGWSRATISLAIAVNLLLFGLMGPFAAALMQSIGVRRTVMAGLALLAGSVAASTAMTASWQLLLTWGILVGLGSGMIALVLGATVANRWFAAHRGLAMGIFSASSATGQLVFLPMLGWVVEHDGWRAVAWIVAGAAAAIVPLVWLLLPEQPEDVNLVAFGATAGQPPPPSAVNPITVAFGALGIGVQSRDFWLLFASFFVCGASTNGLIGTHLISYCLDQGIPEVRGAGLLALMGMFDLVGTTLSGWFTDRYDSRVLLSWYYGLRGLSLIFLPFSGFNAYTLSIFAMFYGLDWLATVPPTVRLATDAFGKQTAPVVFGWIFVGHQLGAATIALVAGAMRAALGSYGPPVMASGILCLAAAVAVL